ncbi:MAG TPA: hypothetical protein VFU71_19610 [Burkholderiaceae bacterium]|nr:hypothetical protein [Burkholderiaceae bacterium]
MNDIQPGSKAPSGAVWRLREGSSRTTDSWYPEKTAEGQAEIRQRHHRLTQRQRTMLLLVDGRRSAAQVKALALQAGATETSFDELLDLGLIAEPPPASPADEATGSATEAADAGGAVTSGPESDADAFEQFELDAERPLEQSTRTTPRRVDSMVSSLLPFIESALGGIGPDDAPITSDNTLEEARRILVREVRNKAPLTGSITVVKLRKARTREELAALFDEVDSHISKPMRHLSARQTLLHVRGLLFGGDLDEPSSPA